MIDMSNLSQEFWKNKKVLVTGGSGFLGSHLVQRLKDLEAEVYTPSHADYDLVDGDQVRKLYKTLLIPR